MVKRGFVVLALLSGCATAPRFHQPYPEHWWKPFPKDKAYSWEVLPQEAGTGEVVLSKRNELGLLSNFASTPFVYHGKKYASLEGFWQMMKYPEDKNDPRAKARDVKWEFTREQVSQMVGFEARDAGTRASENMKKLGINWISFEGERIDYKGKDQARHYEIIEAATREKVNQNPAVKALLGSTGDLNLKPDHHQDPNPPPASRYYDIYMKIRTELRASGEY